MASIRHAIVVVTKLFGRWLDLNAMTFPDLYRTEELLTNRILQCLLGKFASLGRCLRNVEFLT